MQSIRPRIVAHIEASNRSLTAVRTQYRHRSRSTYQPANAAATHNDTAPPRIDYHPSVPWAKAPEVSYKVTDRRGLYRNESSRASRDRPPFQENSQVSSIAADRTAPTRTNQQRRKGPPKEIPPDFFEFLSKTSPQPPPPAGSWLSQLNQDQLISLIPEEFCDSPLKILDNQGADLETVTACLELWIARIHANSDDRQFLRGIFSNFNVGRKALFWAYQNDERFDKSQPNFHALARAVVHCLVAADQMDDIWPWYRAEKLVGQQGNVPEAVLFWRTHLLAHTVESSAFWDTRDPTGLNAGLIAFRRCLYEERFSMPRKQTLGGKRLAGIFLLKRLVTMPTKHTLPRVFDDFCTNLNVLFSDHGDQEFQEAKLSALHPTRPRPISRLEYLQKNAPPEKRSRYFQKMLNDDPGVAWSFCRDSAVLLWRSRNEKGARWVMDFASEVVPTSFHKAYAHWYKIHKLNEEARQTQSTDTAPAIEAKDEPTPRTEDNGTSAFPL